MLDPKKLKKLEGDFLLAYPQGFDDPGMQEAIKKHRFPQMVEKTQAMFDEVACSNVHITVDNMVKIVGASSMVSMFEKPKFRDFARSLSEDEKAFLVGSLSQFLHGNQQLGFEGMVDILKTQKLAKWSLLTIIPTYYAPTKEVFVKPTTVKNILKYFEIIDPVYKPAPTWDFYQKYRDIINQSKAQTNTFVSSTNAAFSGFLMMTTKQYL